MLGFLFRKKSGLSQTRHIPISELAALWRDPDEPEKAAGADMRKSTTVAPPKQTITDNNKIEAIDLETFVTPSGPDPTLNNKDSWYDQKGLIGSLKGFLGGGKTHAFVHGKKAYYTLDTITKALNAQRDIHNLEPMEPGAVIKFFKTDGGLESGKYQMRFDSGLPVKTYLYTHPVGSDFQAIRGLAVDESGRRLKSLNRIQ